jgi:hypothetical protein
MRAPEIFPGRTDIAFIDDVERRADCEAVFKVLKSVAWSSPKTGGHGHSRYRVLRALRQAQVLPNAAG